MTRLATHFKTALAAAAVAAVLPAAASAAPQLAGTFPAAADQITTGPDGVAWYTGGTKQFGRIATDGTITDYVTPGNKPVLAITTGPDVTGGPRNRIWLAYSGGVIKVDPANPNAGTDIPSAKIGAGVRDMEADRDGNLWVIDSDGVTRVTTAAAPTFDEFAAGNSGREITLGGDGRMWWGDFGTSKILATTTAGVTTPEATPDQRLPGHRCRPEQPDRVRPAWPLMGRINPGQAPLMTNSGGDAGFGIVLGQDGAYWTPRFAANDVARLTPEGAYSTPVPMPAGSGPRRIAAGADNTLWVTLETTNQIAKISGVDLAPAPASGVPTRPGADTTKPRSGQAQGQRGQAPLLGASERGGFAAGDDREAHVRQAQGQALPGAQEGSLRQEVRALREGAFLPQGGQGWRQHRELGQEAQARHATGSRWWRWTRPATGSATAKKSFTVKTPRRK